MIETKKSSEKDYYDIYIDGKLCEGAYKEENDYLTVISEASSKLADCLIQEFIPFEYIRLKNLFQWTEFENIVFIAQKFEETGNQVLTKDELQIDISFNANLQEWSKIYSYKEYCEVFSNIWNEINDTELELKFEDETDIGYWVSFRSPYPKTIIKDFLSPYENHFRKIHEKTLNVIASLNKYITMQFNFPESLKISCEQYLLYFAQFLQDLGINATSSLKEDAGKILFSVTPTDDIEALGKIREALAIYLNLPSSPIIYNDSFAAMRLQQQIENLQHSQRMAVRELQFNEKLLIAQSETIREKNLTISQQQFVIEQKDKIIEKISNKSIMIDSAENKEELEEIYNGLKIGESKFLKEQLGIHLNPAKVIKTAVKNTFGKNEKISILDSDEETDKK